MVQWGPLSVESRWMPAAERHPYQAALANYRPSGSGHPAVRATDPARLAQTPSGSNLPVRATDLGKMISIRCLSKRDKPIVIHVRSGQGAENRIAPVKIRQVGTVDALTLEQGSTVGPLFSCGRCTAKKAPHNRVRMGLSSGLLTHLGA
jgi:hypothetical protein